MKIKVKKLLAFLLVTFMVLQFNGITNVFALDQVSNLDISNTETTANESFEQSKVQESEYTSLNTKGDLTMDELQTAVLDEATVPELLDINEVKEKEHVNRLYEQEEDLNTVIFQNKDGTKTMYLYNEPVKYKDKDGKIKDKSTKLSETKDRKNGNKYETTKNDIIVQFPDSITSGLSLQYDKINIKLTPITEKEVKSIKKAEKSSLKTPSDVKDNEKVKYSGVFGDKTEILYTPTYSGVKEDIVLHEYTGQNEFKFSLSTNGLTLCNDNGYIYSRSSDRRGKSISRRNNYI